jgi:hypothetical protein
MLCVILHLLVPQQSGGPLEATLIILENEQLFIKQPSSRLIRQFVDIDTSFEIHDQQKSKKIKLIESKSPFCYKQENENSSMVQIRQPESFHNTIFDKYIPFIHKMITHTVKKKVANIKPLY